MPDKKKTKNISLFLNVHFYTISQVILYQRKSDENEATPRTPVADPLGQNLRPPQMFFEVRTVVLLVSGAVVLLPGQGLEVPNTRMTREL